MLFPRRPSGLVLVVCAVVACLAAAPREVSPAFTGLQAPAPAPGALPLTLPNKDGALKFGVMGDFGTGKPEQYRLGEQMARVPSHFPFELMITVGDNIYGGSKPADFVKKFESPYKALLSAGVKFYASLGNHDSRKQSAYALFNMGGKTYYTFKAPKQDVRFFALESSYLDPTQLQWLERRPQKSREG